MAAMPRIAAACLSAPVPALGGRPMTDVLDPEARLARGARRTRAHRRRGAVDVAALAQSEGIRIVALAGLREAERPETATQWIERARTWFTTEARAA